MDWPVTLSEQQRLFVRLLPRLFDYAHSMGYELTLGDAYRDPRVFGAIGEQKGYGHPKSAHKQRLAIDLNLWKDGNYLTDNDSHAFLGAYWKSLHVLNRHGGDFGDGNHYSQIRDGIR